MTTCHQPCFGFIVGIPHCNAIQCWPSPAWRSTRCLCQVNSNSCCFDLTSPGWIKCCLVWWHIQARDREWIVSPHWCCTEFGISTVKANKRSNTLELKSVPFLFGLLSFSQPLLLLHWFIKSVLSPTEMVCTLYSATCFQRAFGPLSTNMRTCYTLWYLTAWQNGSIKNIMWLTFRKNWTLSNCGPILNP